MGARNSPVRQPRHPTVRILTVLTVGALTSWGTRQSGAPLTPAVTSARTAHTFADDRCTISHCSAWRTGHSSEL
jgi:hypothetical protein